MTDTVITALEYVLKSVYAIMTVFQSQCVIYTSDPPKGVPGLNTKAT